MELIDFTSFLDIDGEYKRLKEDELIITLISLGKKARMEGLLALEDDIDIMEPMFLRKLIQSIVDGYDPEILIAMANCDIDMIKECLTDMHECIAFACIHLHDCDFDRIFDALCSSKRGSWMSSLLHLISSQLREAVTGDMHTEKFPSTRYDDIVSVIHSPFDETIKLRLIENHFDSISRETVLLYRLILDGSDCVQRGFNPEMIKDVMLSSCNPEVRKLLHLEPVDE